MTNEPSTDTHRVTLPGRPVEADLSVAEIVAYLQARGWEEARSDWRWRRFWLGDHSLALIPTSAHPDPARCIRDAVCDIARAEGRHPLDVLADLIAAMGGT